MVKVSVIIPVYNAEAHLRQCLDSVTSQSLTDIEIICVDDGSTDGSLNILREYERADNRFTVLIQENLYAGVARNAGMDVSRGEYLCFLDSDDFFEKDMLSSMYSKAKSTDAQICLCDADKYDELTETFQEMEHFLDHNLLHDHEYFNIDILGDKILKVTNPCPWAKLFSAKFIKEKGIRFSSHHSCNDIFFTLLAQLLSRKTVFIDEIFVHYRSGQTTNLQSSKDIDVLIIPDIYLSLKKSLEKEGIMEKCKTVYYDRLFQNLLYTMKRTERVAQKDYSTLYDELLGHYLTELGVENIRMPEPFYPENFAPLQEKLLSYYKDKYKDNTPSISVIIPVYNSEKYLSQCLDSVINQTFKDIEIICVDDGSTDKSKDILIEYGKMDSRFTVLFYPNSGAGIARNRGLKIARGKYIYFLDSDDYITDNALESFILYAMTGMAEVTVFEADTLFESDELREHYGYFGDRYHRKEIYPVPMRGPKMLCKLLDNNEFRVPVTMQFYLRDFLENNDLLFPPYSHEDELFSFKAMLLSKRVRVTPLRLINRRIREESVMTTPTPLPHFYGYLGTYLDMNSFLLSCHLDSIATAYANRYANSMLRSVKKYYARLSKSDKEKVKNSLSPSLLLLFDDSVNYYSSPGLLEK